LATQGTLKPIPAVVDRGRGWDGQGETVPYIICVEKEEGDPETQVTGDRPSKGVAERAYHPDEVTANGNIMPDLDYYLAQQASTPAATHAEVIKRSDATAQVQTPSIISQLPDLRNSLLSAPVSLLLTCSMTLL
jgi:hypothetical protein